MIEWEFRIEWSHKEEHAQIVTIGKTFADALAFAVRTMVDNGKPWGENDVGTIWLHKFLEYLSPETRPLMTFMPPNQVDPEAL